MTACQRWRDGQHSWRRTSEGGFDRRRYDVALIDSDDLVKRFIIGHHYSGCYPAARLRAGLYDADQLVGAAVFGVPMSERVLTRPFPSLVPYREAIELSRFVLLDEVPANAESWFLTQAFRLIAASGIRGVVAFSDPVPRLRRDGTVVAPGHVGTIYQATNGMYAHSRSTPRTLLLGPDARVISARALQKVRAQERGHEYVERQLVAWGANPRGDGQDPAGWLRGALTAAGVSRVRHPGNHRYVFRLGRTARERSRVVVAVKPAPYPKKHAAKVSGIKPEHADAA